MNDLPSTDISHFHQAELDTIAHLCGFQDGKGCIFTVAFGDMLASFKDEYDLASAMENVTAKPRTLGWYAEAFLLYRLNYIRTNRNPVVEA